MFIYIKCEAEAPLLCFDITFIYSWTESNKMTLQYSKV